MPVQLIAIGVLAVVIAAVLLVVRGRNQSDIVAERWGLTLKDLIDLLPLELRQNDYQHYLVHVREDRVFVGLVLPRVGDGRPPRCGNPDNVGLEFDLGTGRLLAVHPHGVALGVK